ncbi:hypothetical protein E6C50_07605 [Flavobacterium supellecticarium]|uniref:Uncharacterized protein n=1 Tax=Flavobacterium supellecticarium TaxID=2565924 RepID=A0A4S4A022_9FLAO|nr:hypothetical protein [Flavobacterium supellecticarium]THF51621.1 hypothetical protein E6C50_07605 [Flavobacterium supellecticarium]
MAYLTIQPLYSYAFLFPKLPGSPIDTLRTFEKIKNSEFQVFTITQKPPSQKTFTILLYDRLFGKKELAVTSLYRDEDNGKTTVIHLAKFYIFKESAKTGHTKEKTGFLFIIVSTTWVHFFCSTKTDIAM